MKKVLLVALFSVSLLSYAQYTLPSESPRASSTQQFSLSQVSVDYGRPGVKGRKVFGDLVPYGKVWRAGANSSTKITFGQNVLFQGKKVAKGTYGLFIEPNENSWRVILSKDSQSWGTAYNKENDLLDVVITPEKTNQKIEWYTMNLTPVSKNELELEILWENTKGKVSIKADNEKGLTQIEEKLGEIRQIERNAPKN